MKDKFFEKILLTSLAAMLIFAVLARGGARFWASCLLLAAEFTLVWIWLLRSPQKPCGTRLDRPMFLLFLLAVITGVFSIYKFASFFAILQFLGYAGVYYLVANNFGRSSRRALFNIIIVFAAALSIYGLLQYCGFLPHSWWAPKEFLAATYVNHNHFAGLLELIIPLCVGMLFAGRDKSVFYRPVLCLALLIMSIAFILTQSRGGWISLAAALLAMDFILIKRGFLNKRSVLILVLLLALLFCFIYFYDASVAGRVGAILRIPQEATLESRVKIWQGTLGMIRSRPLTGVGPGNFELGFTRFRPEGLHLKANFAHNDYLQAAAEMGVFAPLIIFWMLGALFFFGIRRKTFSPRIAGCAAGVLSLSLHGLVDFNFHIPANMLLLAVYAALIMSNASLKEP